MTSDKFSAVWVSHSSISDFIKCPRAYFLNNVYKDPSTGHKITLTNPPLALGQAVHEVVESLSLLPTVDRFKEPLSNKLEIAWKKISGNLGGFSSKAQEERYKQRATTMLKNLSNNPGPLKNLAVKIKMSLPHYWLSEEENIILCGKIDWLEYLKKDESVHIIDFKTGRSAEDPTSLQLPIYHLLVHNCQNRAVKKASYWYLENSSNLTEKKLPNLKKAHLAVLKIAKQIKLARSLGRFKCPHGSGCKFCTPYENIIAGRAKLVGENEYHQDVYVLDTTQAKPQSELL